MLDFGGSMESFLLALFGFLNELLNGIFNFLTAFFDGLNVNIST